jgi:lipoyl(octanoyl) transferase
MTNDNQSSLCWDFLGTVPYTDAWHLQKQLREERIQGLIQDHLLLLEHPATITLGRLRGEESLRESSEQLEERGVTVLRSDRGGDATLHAPGQLVGYCIVDLNQRKLTLPAFVETLAEGFVSLLAKRGVTAHYDSDFPGVWVGERKIVAFGFHLKQNVSMHGFAFNLHTDLGLFDLIVPCGLQHRGVASLRQEQADSTETPGSIAEEVARTLASRISLPAVQTSLKERL